MTTKTEVENRVKFRPTCRSPHGKLANAARKRRRRDLEDDASTVPSKRARRAATTAALTEKNDQTDDAAPLIDNDDDEVHDAGTDEQAEDAPADGSGRGSRRGRSRARQASSEPKVPKKKKGKGQTSRKKTKKGGAGDSAAPDDEDPDDESDGDKPDCYIMGATEAEQFLESDAEIKAPVFVPDGAKEGLFTGSNDRPIQQVLNSWLFDVREKFTTIDSGRSAATHFLAHVDDLRGRFLTPPAVRDLPWNLPDIPNLRGQMCQPPFLQSLNCNLLRDVVRRALDVTERNVCPGNTCADLYNDRLGCSNATQKVTRGEYHQLQDGWERWQGTVMLADPGAITLAHWDRWGLGTWISCHKGQIGLIWRSHPSNQERTNHLNDGYSAALEGTSLYKVLRPGEAVYMPPGTIHTVFRRPSGTHSLAFAGNILRRTALDKWLQLLDQEVADVVDDCEDVKDGAGYEHIIPALCGALRNVIPTNNDSPEASMFGGRDALGRAITIRTRLRNSARRLRQLAFVKPAPVWADNTPATARNQAR